MSDFKRLTERDGFKYASLIGVDDDILRSNLYFGEMSPIIDAFDRLAAYEDTTLTPEQVTALQTRNDELTAMLGAALGELKRYVGCDGCSHGYLGRCDRPEETCEWSWSGCNRYDNVPEFPAKGE